MPLCPQITNTPITVSLTADFTVTNVVPVVPATTEDVANVVVLANGKTKAYYQTTAPTTGLNEGDIWFDTDDGNKQYYYNGTAWVSVQDTAIAAADAAAVAAAAAATAAQTTADGKNKVFRQTSAPTASAVGDLWFDTDDDNRIYRWSGTSWVANDLGNNALASISANKITAGTIDASVITVSNINAGNISTGTLNADRIASASITGTKIAAGTITASNITSGTITASQIATGTITATQIATGTITATQIASSTITATQIAAGTITVDKLSAGTLTGFTIQTNSVNNRIIMGSSNNALSFYYNGNPVAHMVATTGGAGVWLHNGATASPSTRSYPLVGMSTSDASLEGSSVYQIVSSSTGNVIYGAATLTSSINVNASATFGTSNTFEYLSSSGTLRSLYTYGVARTSSTRTMIIDSNGNFGTTASTRRKKHEIQSYKIDSNALLNLDVKTFKYKPEFDPNQQVQHGFIAEEAQELGLDELIQYDSTGVPDYFAYEKLPIFLLQLAQEQEVRIQALEGK